MSLAAGETQNTFDTLKYILEHMIEARNITHALTRNEPQTLRSPLSLIAADIVSPAATRTARNSSSTRDCKG